MEKKEFIIKILDRLNFVMWDRYFGEKDLTFFGWINREDNYKDFVVLQFMDSEEGLCLGFSTSSKEYSQEIARILGLTHSDCKRIESFCDLPNVIKLGERE